MGIDGGKDRWDRPPNFTREERNMVAPGVPGGTDPKLNNRPQGSVRVRARSAPPCTSRRRCRDTICLTSGEPVIRRDLDISLPKFMLSAPAVDQTFEDDGWTAPQVTARLYRAASVGNSWGVTSIGRGFDWNEDIEPQNRGKETSRQQLDIEVMDSHLCKLNNGFPHSLKIIRPVTNAAQVSQSLMTPPTIHSPEPLFMSPTDSHSPSTSLSGSVGSHRPPPPSRSPSSPRSRRRSSQQRVSLIAGRVSIAPMEPPSPPPMLPPSLHRAGSSNSLLSAASTRPPSPYPVKESFLGGRNISEFVIEGEIGRGAYGLVKRGREIQEDGSLGVSGPFLVAHFPCVEDVGAAPLGHQADH
jgi:hypothetical protein